MSKGTGRYLVASSLVLALFVAPLAVARTGDTIRGGERNPITRRLHARNAGHRPERHLRHPPVEHQERRRRGRDLRLPERGRQGAVHPGQQPHSGPRVRVRQPQRHRGRRDRGRQRRPEHEGGPVPHQCRRQGGEPERRQGRRPELRADRRRGQAAVGGGDRHRLRSRATTARRARLSSPRAITKSSSTGTSRIAPTSRRSGRQMQPTRSRVRSAWRSGPAMRERCAS